MVDIISKVKESKLSDKFIMTGDPIKTSGEIRPTDVVPVIASNKLGKRDIFPMKWGFRIPGRSLIVNSRVETAAEKPTFIEAWNNHRCIIPASWYFEWEHLIGNSGERATGHKYLIQPSGESFTWLAGLYRIEDGFPVFTVLTKEPTAELRRIHDRMPLIFPRDVIEDWIDPGSDPAELKKYALTEMHAEKVV